MRLFDSHAHYYDDAFAPDRDAVLSALPGQGVELVVNPGCDLESSRKAVELAGRYPFVYAAVGVHPEDCGDWKDEDVEELRSYLSPGNILTVRYVYEGTGGYNAVQLPMPMVAGREN